MVNFQPHTLRRPPRAGGCGSARLSRSGFKPLRWRESALASPRHQRPSTNPARGDRLQYYTDAQPSAPRTAVRISLSPDARSQPAVPRRSCAGPASTADRVGWTRTIACSLDPSPSAYILCLTGAPRRPAHWRGRRGFVEMPFHRALSLGLVVLSLLSACARVEPPIAPPTLGDASQTPPPSQTPTPAPSPSPTSTPQAVCRDRAGRILTAEIPLPGDPRPLAYLVYLPPCYDPERETRYPTLYLMHGLAQSEFGVG